MLPGVRFLAASVLAVWIGLATAQSVVVPTPGARDLCPVCGMLVSKYPNWVATVYYRDGHAHHFDGAKDMFKYLADLPKYAPNHRREDIVTIAVTDYYNLQKIDAKKAFYVIGTDVYGPMGHEFIPLATRSDADDFLREHKGKKIIRFDEVKPDLPARVDDGKF